LPHYYTHISKDRYFLNRSFEGGIVNFTGSCQEFKVSSTC